VGAARCWSPFSSGKARAVGKLIVTPAADGGLGCALAGNASSGRARSQRIQGGYHVKELDLSGLSDHDRATIAMLAHQFKKSPSEIVSAAVAYFFDTIQARRTDDEDVAKAYRDKLREHFGGRGQA
jgi:hypothetical protein